MSITARNVIAFIAGLFVGSIVNGSLIALSPVVIPPPPGVDVTDAESLAASIHLFEPRHFIMPFLAHALGTLAGALTAYLLVSAHRANWAYARGMLFLAGGIAASFMIPAPAWFIALDLLLAYIPMAWLAVQIGARMKKHPAERPVEVL